jgi:putative transcriptional regulator
LVQGRRPDYEKRRQARALRENGWTNARIAKLMGISKQAVSRLANSLGSVKAPDLLCSKCRAVIIPNANWRSRNGACLCLPCLKRKKRPTFAERLKTYRLDRGLSQSELAKKVGCGLMTVAGIEQGQREPLFGMLVRLVRVLGQGLVSEPPL